MKYNCPVYLCKVLFRIYGTPTTLATDYICRYFGLLRFDLFLHCFPLLICCCHTHLIIIFLLSTYFVISFFEVVINSYNAYFKLVYLFVCLCLHLKFICSVHELTHGKQPKCKKKKYNNNNFTFTLCTLRHFCCQLFFGVYAYSL